MYFKRKAAYPHKRTEKSDLEWDRLCKAYDMHLQRIRKSLPENVRALSRANFHDATIVSIARPSKSDIVITLRGGYLHSGFSILSFYGVKKAWLPDTVIGDTLLYEEVHLSEWAVFDYQVLLEKDEIRIHADDVRIELEAGRAI